MELIIGKEYYISIDEENYEKVTLVSYNKYSAMFEKSKNSYIEKSIYDIFETEKELLVFNKELKNATQEFVNKLDILIDLISKYKNCSSFDDNKIISELNKINYAYNIVYRRKDNESSIVDGQLELESVLDLNVGYLRIIWGEDKDGNIENFGIEIVEPYQQGNKTSFSPVCYSSEPNRYKKRQIRNFILDYKGLRRKGVI